MINDHAVSEQESEAQGSSSVKDSVREPRIVGINNHHDHHFHHRQIQEIRDPNNLSNSRPAASSPTDS